ncbi:LysR family transcriptional regulator [Halotalea alkalilenta]|uniref:LysR family transcriptional regulator n=1 Tax=Halotalea alkalilenta TaxID=376489 RepID=UPI00047F2DF4|nr:LysR family transcriptional regulator [Halotalea alkalilenta]
MKQTLRVHNAAIHYFDMVRRCGSIREAARRLNVASSAVSRQIIKLEDEIQAPLFERLPSGLKLTTAGEIFARHVMVVMQDTERTRSELGALRGLRSGHVRLAIVEGLISDLMPTVIERMRERYPNISTDIAILGSQQIPEALAKGQADLGVAFSLKRHADLRQLAIAHFELGAIMRPDHPLARHAELNLITCSQYPMILPTPELSLYQLVAPLFSGQERPTNGVARVSSVELAKQMAKRGVGIAFQTRIGILEELEKETLAFVPVRLGGPIYSDLGVYARNGRFLPVAADAYARALNEEIVARGQGDRRQW